MIEMLILLKIQSIHKILRTYLKRNDDFWILKILKILFNENNGGVNFTENTIYLQILSTYLKRNDNVWILKILKILFNEK